MKSSTIATTALVLALACIAGPAAADSFAACSAPVKSTAYDNPADDDGGVFVGNHPTQGTNDRMAQSFTLSSPVALNKVGLYLVSGPSQSQSIVVEIRSDSAGKPGAILATRSAVFTNPDNYPHFNGLDFSTDRLALAAGTPYFIVAQSAGTYAWEWDDSSPTYSGGEAFRSTSSAPSWAPQSSDLLFQVFGQTCTADTQPGGQTQNPPLAAVSGLAFSNTSFAAEASGPPATNARRKRPPLGTTVSFTLNEAASVRFTVRRKAKGRKVKRGKKTRCVKRTKKNRNKRACTRLVALKGSFTRAGVAGKNIFHFTGRLRGRKLKPGRYRLVATPRAGGKKGKPTSTSFRIVR